MISLPRGTGRELAGAGGVGGAIGFPSLIRHHLRRCLPRSLAPCMGALLAIGEPAQRLARIHLCEVGRRLEDPARVDVSAKVRIMEADSGHFGLGVAGIRP
jgi:hypothetical protein